MLSLGCLLATGQLANPGHGHETRVSRLMGLGVNSKQYHVEGFGSPVYFGEYMK